MFYTNKKNYILTANIVKNIYLASWSWKSAIFVSIFVQGLGSKIKVKKFWLAA